MPLTGGQCYLVHQSWLHSPRHFPGYRGRCRSQCRGRGPGWISTRVAPCHLSHSYILPLSMLVCFCSYARSPWIVSAGCDPAPVVRPVLLQTCDRCLCSRQALRLDEGPGGNIREGGGGGLNRVQEGKEGNGIPNPVFSF